MIQDAYQVTSPVIAYRPAVQQDESAAAGILTHAAKWLEKNNLWNDWPIPYPTELVRPDILNQKLYLGFDGRGEARVTGTLRWSDVRNWGPAPDNAGYVHRLAAPPPAGTGEGKKMLLHLADRCRHAGKLYLRLDCPSTNEKLVDYYSRLGFQSRGSVTRGAYNGLLLEASVYRLIL